MAHKCAWTCEQKQRNVFELTIPYTRNAKWEWWLLCVSDLHLDSVHCNRKLLAKHFKEAQSKEAGIVAIGDVMDALQGVGDKRGCKSQLKNKYNVPNYWDALVEDCADWLSPYAQNIIMLSRGNHEGSVMKYHETDLTQRLVGHLNITRKTNIQYGSYAGWLRMMFKEGDKGNGSRFIHLNYHHGTGYSKASAAIKRGGMLPDADICLYGDKHVMWKEWVGRDRLTSFGQQYHDKQLHLAMPSYKNEYADGSTGYAVEKGYRPGVMGGWWLRFFWDREAQRVLFDTREAQ